MSITVNCVAFDPLTIEMERKWNIIGNSELRTIFAFDGSIQINALDWKQKDRIFGLTLLA